MDAFLWILPKSVKNTIFTERFETPGSAFVEHICNIKKIDFN